MPSALYHCAACVLDHNIYVVGSMDHVPLTATANVWTTLAPIPEAKVGQSVCVMSGKVYVLEGRLEPHGGEMSCSCHRYDPMAITWSALAPMSTPRDGSVSFVLGGHLRAAGAVMTKTIQYLRRSATTRAQIAGRR
jgi:kelch-like protein 1/4/5